jgi:hypothetical protein
VAWLRAASLVGFGLVLAELTLRGLYGGGVLPMSLYWAYGPASGRLGYTYANGGSVEAPQFRFDPELGWVNNPGVYVQNGSTITVDDRGLRSTGAAPEARGGLRVMITGDSFAFGADADDAWWYGARLEQLTGCDLVDVAVQSYGADQAYLRYLREVEAWRPDVVILALNPLMADRNLKDFELGPKPLFPAEEGADGPVNLPLPDPEATRADLAWRSRLVLTLQMAAWWAWSDTDARYDLTGARMAAIADRFVADARQRGIVPIVAWFPIDEEVRRLARGERAEVFDGAPCPLAAAACVDPTAALVPLLERGVPLTNGTHWSREVSEVVAGELARAVEAVTPPARTSP